MTQTIPELASDLRDWECAGFDRAHLAWLFPLVPFCEFSSVPLHGCECNGCVEWRLEAVTR